MNTKKALAAVVMMVAMANVAAHGYSVYVPATADIYLARQVVGTQINNPACQTVDSVPQQAACEADGLDLAPGSWLRFTATGQASNWGGGLVGPDGQESLTATDTVAGTTTIVGTGYVWDWFNPLPLTLSGHVGIPVAGLIGVFTADAMPPLGTASVLPPSLDFTTSGLTRNFTLLTPELRQIFFIGDGRTDGGVLQEFLVPSGATHLFLAIDDSPGTYVGNPGGFTVGIEAVPEPSSILALLVGLGSLGGVMRLKRR